MTELRLLEMDSLSFPPTFNALKDPDGLLAVGGDLSPERLICAYKQGIFPWYSDGQPILWWTPDPRTVLAPNALHIGRTLKKLINKRPYKITVDRAFSRVISLCETIPRNGETGTWITEEVRAAYMSLHNHGIAHSIEAWSDTELVGGLYGVSLGRVFFGESMFSRASGASKIAFVTLVRQLQLWNFTLIDCQIYTDYLASFGAEQISRTDFESVLKESIPETIDFDKLTQLDPNNCWADAWSMPEYGIE